MDNKHRKLFVIRQSKECRFMPKMHQNTFGGCARTRWASLCALTAAIAKVLLRGGREGEESGNGKREANALRIE